MQPVEKRKTRDRKHSRWLLPGLLLALTAAVILLTAGLNRKTEPEAAKEPEQGGVLIRRSADEIDTVTVTRRGGESWTAEREEGTLYPAGDRTLQVDPLVGDPLQDALAHLDYERVLTDRPEDYLSAPEDFGLGDPLVTADCRFTDGERLTVRIGDRVSGTEENWYYMTVSGDDRLFAASAGTVQDLNVEQALLHPVEQPRILAALLDRITLTDGEGKPVREWKLRGRITDPDAGENWLITAPFAYPADGEAIRGLKENAENLRMGTWYGPATAENLAATGLDRPKQRLIFHMAEGSTGTVSLDSGVYDVQNWPESTVTIALGADRDENVFWVLYQDQICAVNRLSFSAFTDTDPLSTAARYPAATPLASLSELETEENGLRTVYRLEHGENGDFSVTKNGEPLSPEVFEAAYDRLLTVTVSGRLPEGTVPGETQKKYTFRTTSGGTHTLEFWPFDALHQGLTQDGYALFYLIRDRMTELP